MLSFSLLLVVNLLLVALIGRRAGRDVLKARLM